MFHMNCTAICVAQNLPFSECNGQQNRLGQGHSCGFV